MPPLAPPKWNPEDGLWYNSCPVQWPLRCTCTVTVSLLSVTKIIAIYCYLMDDTCAISSHIPFHPSNNIVPHTNVWESMEIPFQYIKSHENLLHENPYQVLQVMHTTSEHAMTSSKIIERLITIVPSYTRNHISCWHCVVLRWYYMHVHNKGITPDNGIFDQMCLEVLWLCNK